jgi:uncharacterized cupredoxin-like copper-binding protein
MVTMRMQIMALTCLLLSGPVQAQDAAQQITITLSSYAFTPKTIALTAGAPVRLHLVNSSDKSHSFTAREFFAAATIAPDDATKVRDGGIELDGGQTVDVGLTPTRPGAYALRCTHFMHSGLGMTGTITVQ